MDFHTLHVRCVGRTALLMHATTGMDVTHPLVKEMRALTKKHASKKTEEDVIEIQRLEFALGIYHDGDRPVISADMVLAAVRDGAKAMRLGKEVERSVFLAEEAVPLEYEGPKSVSALWKNKRFVDSRTVKVGAARVLRTRPKFEAWSLSFALEYDPDHLDRDALERAVVNAGSRVGLGDYRPRYGRFDVEFV